MGKTFKIEGIIETNTDMTHDEFWKLFIEMIEEKGMCFAGVTDEVEE